MDGFQHGGDIRSLSLRTGLPASRILDFSANINPLGPPEWLRAVVSSSLSEIVHYPDPACTRLKHAICDRYNVAVTEVLVGNGSTELIYMLPRALGAERAVVVTPTYLDYAPASKQAGMEVRAHRLREEDGFRLDVQALGDELSGDELVFLCHPNNPTGLPVDVGALRKLALSLPHAVFIVDEAFMDLSEGLDSLTVDRPSNVIVLLSLTKTYAIPGMRLGCALADSEVVERVNGAAPPWSVNSLAQTVGVEALRDTDYVRRGKEFVSNMRASLIADLKMLPGLTVYPGRANYLLVRLDRSDMDASTLAERALKDGIAIRKCANFDGLDDRFFRVAVRTEPENMRLCDSLRNAMGARKRSIKARTPAIMFQGTSSNAGKSVMTAALCRIMLQDGFRVAPFKAQNMSLNSFVTRTGEEMGRAQVTQAQACRLEPDVRMNPILLKPNSDTGSQVIVMGHPVGNMGVRDYVDYKPVAFEQAKAAYNSLAQEFDAIVIEGAGSPAEVNLKHHDIVNMAMARYAEAPVILVGDIDRGGVFASFVGTMEVLAEWERNLIAGFVANRFRGDPSILDEAFLYTLRHTGKPVLGVAPYIKDLGLPEEDSVSFKDELFRDAQPDGDCVNIAVIDLPHISNFTDFDALKLEPDVRLTVVRSLNDLISADAVILPGSKNVQGDLAYLNESGLAQKIQSMTTGGTVELVGICGGFQMLGKTISDPYGIESDRSTIDGLGLLDVYTVMGSEKTLTRVEASHVESGLDVFGYEIHHGVTDSSSGQPALIGKDSAPMGFRSPDGHIWGAYMHGIFDSDPFRRWFVDRLRSRKGMAPVGRTLAKYDLEPAFDRLARITRDSLPIERIYEIMGLSRK